MTELHRNAAVLLKRAEGRLINVNGQLGLVVNVDCDEQLARVSRKTDTGREVLELSLHDLSLLLSDQQSGTLDALPSANSRISQDGNAWFFASRDGRQGPFGSEEEAEEALQQYILAQQAEPRSRVAAGA